ncbi:MAG: hypothetical protein HY220_00880 [Candidatus Sungbacteria bacterium]|uniref:Uncharacterized protein n=1 Tax=Candidatus Sungiibacteriota bacterium TaxID=2750080 RepID=A0A9D6LQN3_9BACT|nr:hypothetical protein [Candidatus Sungbacteria bacterium]
MRIFLQHIEDIEKNLTVRVFLMLAFVSSLILYGALINLVAARQFTLDAFSKELVKAKADNAKMTTRLLQGMAILDENPNPDALQMQSVGSDLTYIYTNAVFVDARLK